jgi:xanthine dehydrogenase accessory factor
MVVVEDEIFGTIGGGHLEFKTIEKAREQLKKGEDEQHIEHFPLGASLGQCCGGSTSVLFECFSGSGINIVLFGAGHVGKALVNILSELPCKVHWVDNREEQFPDNTPSNVRKILTESPAHEVDTMPANSWYLVMTHNHPLDFEITERVLRRADSAYLGLIGSDTKWRRFKMRFEHMGHAQDFYAPVRCPVGHSDVPGKLPMEVAVSISAEIIAEYQSLKAPTPTQQGIHWRDLRGTRSELETPAIEDNQV